MNINKKLDRFKQWAGEQMGGEVKTNLSDDFRALEMEMSLRQEGLDKMHKSMTSYTKAISKRSEVEGKEKTVPIAHLGATMIAHGEDFEPESEIGSCLTLFGRTQERLARNQETFVVAATASWLESLERGLAQMKEYQNSRKKLDNRRLAYDTSLAKMQKAKREDFRVEEELRTQKVKYEESADDVQRRMEDIRESDPEIVADLTAFLDAELAYHERCREALVQLKAEWPARSNTRPGRAHPRSRTNTIMSVEEPPPPLAVETRPSIRSNRTVSGRVDGLSPISPARPHFGRSTTMDTVSQVRRDLSPAEHIRPLTRVPSDSLMIRTAKSNLRNVDNTYHQDHDVFADDSTLYNDTNSEYAYTDMSAYSPATSHGSSTAGAPLGGGRKGPPPPPPSRAKKPPPPPPAKKGLIA